MKVFGSNTSKAVAVPLFVLAMALALLGPWTHSVVAQVSGATLTGVVTDEQGGPVPDAAVKIKNLGTGVTREVRTNSDGLYSAPNLNPGSYDVTISAKGFQNVVQHSVTLNGGPGGASGLNLGVDGIQEFSVLTSNYTAEYGRTSGAVINAISKSGVNEFHGTAFLFDRDKIFDAKNYFDPAGAIPPFRRVQFGGSGGTALRKDKTFVYGTYEGVRQN